MSAAFGSQAVISEESQSNECDNRTGGTLQLSTCGSSSSHLTQSDGKAPLLSLKSMIFSTFKAN